MPLAADHNVHEMSTSIKIIKPTIKKKKKCTEKKKHTNANANRLKFSTYFAACTEQPRPILPPTTHRHVHPRWLTQLWHLEFGLVLFSFVYFLILSAWHFSIKPPFNPGVFFLLQFPHSGEWTMCEMLRHCHRSSTSTDVTSSRLSSAAFFIFPSWVCSPSHSSAHSPFPLCRHSTFYFFPLNCFPTEPQRGHEVGRGERPLILGSWDNYVGITG